MPYDTGIADRLRAMGLKVVEVNDWRIRGSSAFNPRGSVDHHTADGPGNIPSLKILIEGHSRLSGPLCNVGIARDNTCYVIAAGRANHAGTGGWKGLSGNSSVYGVERENRGTTADPWRSDQTETAAKCHAALIKGRATADFVCGHREWTTRKVDAHSVNYSVFRNMVRNATAPVPEPDPIMEEDSMAAGFVTKDNVIAGFGVDSSGRLFHNYYSELKWHWKSLATGCIPGSQPWLHRDFQGQPGRIDVYAEGAKGGLIHAWYVPGIQDWTSEELPTA